MQNNPLFPSPENLFGNIVRPLNGKHIVRAVVAYLLNEAGELLTHEDATDSEELAALKKKIAASKRKRPAKEDGADPFEGNGNGPENEGDDLAGKAE